MAVETECLVVGAGMAGLMAAQRLQAAGRTVMVLDKGRGVGGRMASRRLPGAWGRCDHGAQYFTVRSAELQPYRDQWLAAGALRQWSDGFYDADGAPHFNGDPRYVGTAGMTSVPKLLAADLDVRTGTPVSAIRWSGAFYVDTAGGAVYSAESLVLTPPVPQTLALLDAGNITLDDSTRHALEQVSYDPCFAVLVALDGPSRVPAPGGVWPTDGGPVAWLSDNYQKGISDQHAVTIHATPAFTRAHFDDGEMSVAAALIQAAMPWLGSDIVHYQVQRWRYSIPTALYPEPALVINTPGVIAFAGDAFAGPRVEGAALSGLAAATAILG